VSNIATASTRVAGVIGDPVRHSLSPVLHNAAFRATGLDWVYVAFPVAAGGGAAAVAAMRTLGIDGLSVTMPHKADVAAAVDRLEPAAAALGVANTVFRRGDELVGDSTDGQGFLKALAAEAAYELHDARCAVLGSGGAARSVIHALAEAGAADVVVVARSPERAAAAAAVGGTVGRTGDRADIPDCDLVVNATPAGMVGTGLAGELPLGVSAAYLNHAQLVVDLVYAPPITPFLEAAHLREARTANGLGMLVHQAALQFELWTGVEAPIEVMRDAVVTVLAGHDS
jgi:shikimate dehydrogenase